MGRILSEQGRYEALELVLVSLLLCLSAVHLSDIHGKTNKLKQLHAPAPTQLPQSIPDKKTLLYCVDRCTSDAPEESGVDRQ